MDRFALVLSSGSSLESTKECYGNTDQSPKEELNECSVVADCESSFLTWLTGNHRQFAAFCDLDIPKSGYSLTNQRWLEIPRILIDENLDDFSLITRLIEHLHKADETTNIDRQGTEAHDDPMNYLHQLADDLPLPGSYVLEVVILIGEAGMVPPEDFISFYGFLERLQLWHQAKINVIDMGDFTSDNAENVRRLELEKWKDIFEFGRIKRSCFSLTIRPSILWGGSLCLKQENGCHTRISGLELRHDVNTLATISEKAISDKKYANLMLGDEIEVLKVIEDYDIPLHVLCHARLVLTLRQDCDESSTFFFNVVQEAGLENLCFLGCMFYNLAGIHDKDLKTRTTEDWLDYVNDKKTEYLVLNDLKKHLPKRCMIVIRGSGDKNMLDVFFVRDSDCFSSDGLRNFINYEHSFSAQEIDDNPKAKWKLPVLSEKECLQRQLEKFENIYQKLEEFEDGKSYEGTVSDEDAMWDNPRISEYIEVNDLDTEEDNYSMQYSAVNLISPSKWPERLSWNNQEISASISSKGSLKRFQSGENHMKLKGIPVTPETQSKGVAESFLQMRDSFDVMGKPVNTDLKSIPLVADRLFKQLPSEDDVRKLPFPKALQLIAHGIDYCLDSQNSLKLDAKLVRIQERFLSNDTSCSWAPVEVIKVRAQDRQSCEVRKETCTIDSKSLKAVKDTVTTSCDKISKSSIRTERPNVKIPAKVKKLRNSNEGTEVDAPYSKPAKETRSQRHQRRLKVICEATLLKYGGLRKDDPLFERCVTRLFSLCKSFLKDLKTSEGLIYEMKKLAKSNVSQVVEFEKRGR